MTAAAVAAQSTDGSAEFKTYQPMGGQTYFALSVTPPTDASKSGPRDIVVLFDTSASQAGVYRDTALAALEACLAKLDAEDRVRIVAVDLDARPLTDSFVAAHGDEARAAVEAIKNESPLGTTDMEKALRDSIALFGDSGNPRAVLYVGDGMSSANFLGTESFRKLASDLVEEQIPVSSYAIGPQRDARLLMAIANQTGGNVYIDEPMVWTSDEVTADRAHAENIRRGQVIGGHLADWAGATVFWPGEASWPVELGEVYPKRMPPLRTDRDTVVIGAAAKPIEGTLEVSVPVGDRDLRWKLRPVTEGDGLSFLSRVVEMARTDGGITLPTVGLAGLAETGRMVNESVDSMTALAERAVATGDMQTANLMAEVVLQSDPGNIQAQTIQRAARQQPKASLAAQPLPQPLPPAEVEVDENELSLIRPAQGIESVPPPDSRVQRDPAAPFPVAGALTDQFADDGEFLDTVEEQRRVFAQMMRREVENAVIDARRTMSDDPDAAAQTLKLALENVERAPELSAAMRAQLVDRLQIALREVQRAATIKDERDAAREEELAAARERRLLNERFERDRERESQLINRFNALIDERRFDEATEIAAVVEELDPEGVTPRVATVWSRLRRNHYLQQVARAARWNNYFDTLYQVELSSIPFPDDPPIVYPDATIWEELSNRRKERYGSMDLKATGEAEERIEKALRNPVISAGLEFTDQPLEEVVTQLQDDYEIPIQLDVPALDNAGIGPDEPVTISLRNVSLRSALRLMLKQLQLTYIIQDEVLMITTPEEAEAQLTVKVYPVADLVLPVDASLLGGGMMGGGMMGGGMMGGGMGGMGGGMGGMGGGMGGMGGGMGGMGGGMGGGMFSVPDDAHATPEKPTVGVGTVTPKAGTAGMGRSAPASKPAAIAVDESVDQNKFWDHHFSAGPADPAAVRETVRQFLAKKQYEGAIALIQSALRHGQPQPWMYESLGIALELGGRSQAEIERAVMSAVDFSNSPDELMYIAQYLTRMGLDRRAMQVYQQVVKVEPLRSEAYALGLRSAEKCDDLAGIQWATVGVLSQAWPADMAAIELTASRVAKAMLSRLDAEGRIEERDAFLKQLQEAVVRDCVVRVSWTGNADVDLSVEEPSGSICSSAAPRSVGGGVSMGDFYALEGESGEGWNEVYICPKGFNGTYRAKIRRVWGEVTAGKVTVDVYRHLRSGEVEHERQQLEVGENDAMVVFELERGRRTEPIEAVQLASAVKRQEAISHAVLAQQLSSGSDQSVFPIRPGDSVGELLRRRRALFGGGAVGFQPIIQTLSDGTNFMTTAVVSADRRYVRLAVFPSFQTIGDVQTFTFAGEAEQVDDNGGDDGAGGGGGAGGAGFGF